MYKSDPNFTDEAYPAGKTFLSYHEVEICDSSEIFYTALWEILQLERSLLDYNIYDILQVRLPHANPSVSKCFNETLRELPKSRID